MFLSVSLPLCRGGISTVEAFAWLSILAARAPLHALPVRSACIHVCSSYSLRSAPLLPEGCLASRAFAAHRVRPEFQSVVHVTRERCCWVAWCCFFAICLCAVVEHAPRRLPQRVHMGARENVQFCGAGEGHACHSTYWRAKSPLSCWRRASGVADFFLVGLPVREPC